MQDGSMLPKIVPWLWRLADEQHNTFQVHGHVLPVGLRNAMGLCVHRREGVHGNTCSTHPKDAKSNKL